MGSKQRDMSLIYKTTQDNRTVPNKDRDVNPHNKLTKLIAYFSDISFGRTLDTKFGRGNKNASKTYIHNLLQGTTKYGFGENFEHPLSMEAIVGYIALNDELVAQEKILWVNDYGAGKGHFEYITMEELTSGNKKFPSPKSTGLGDCLVDYGIWCPRWGLSPMRVVKYKLMLEE